MKRVLILCTGNSCRSIIAEALINRYLPNIEAKSSGVDAKKEVNPNAKKILIEKGCWDNRYYSKDIKEVIDEDFDLVVSVCDNANKNCPSFPKPIKHIHIPFKDPDGKDYNEFIKTFNEIKNKLLPIIEKELA
ncbi:MAG: arsenate reductase ArsC [Epsilonproteobacteria bacterium]|nr:arsenate reductase ArsC [Campylobacterota bacterium]